MINDLHWDVIEHSQDDAEQEVREMLSEGLLESRKPCKKK